MSTCEKDKALAGGKPLIYDKLKRVEPATYGFERQRPTPTPLRPAAFRLLSANYDVYVTTGEYNFKSEIGFFFHTST